MLGRFFPVRSRRRAAARKLYALLVGEREFQSPIHLRSKYRVLPPEKRGRLVESLKAHYFSYPYYYPDPIDEYLSTEVGRSDLKDHLEGRLETSRLWQIPWLDYAYPLAGARILEIGCGTGASTVALAEQGARVTGVDVHEGSLRVAETRLRSYGLSARFDLANATEVRQRFGGEPFDFIILFASLEHMTLEERLGSIRSLWEMLPSGGRLVVIETPNRLWYVDVHTSLAPYFLWLPDDVAFLYSRLTPREIFNRLFRDPTTEANLQFSRWGRGVSFHDFVLALDCPAERLPVESCMTLYFRSQTREWRPRFLNSFSLDRRFEAILRDIQPRIHAGFCLPYLDLVFLKP